MEDWNGPITLHTISVQRTVHFRSFFLLCGEMLPSTLRPLKNCTHTLQKSWFCAKCNIHLSNSFHEICYFSEASVDHILSTWWKMYKMYKMLIKPKSTGFCHSYNTSMTHKHSIRDKPNQYNTQLKIAPSVTVNTLRKLSNFLQLKRSSISPNNHSHINISI